MRRDVAEDFRWQAGYLRQIVLQMAPVRIACRVRRGRYLRQYREQFTIRASRPQGQQTELAKILDGFGDYLLYGFGQDDWRFAPWTLASLDVFRRYYRPGMGQARDNGDRSSSFLAFRWDELPGDFIVATSMGVQGSLPL
jgi:hypothetical protein